MLDTNNIINSLDRKQSCRSLFVDLSIAFDSVDHHLLLQRLKHIGLSEVALNKFENYLSE